VGGPVPVVQCEGAVDLPDLRLELVEQDSVPGQEARLAVYVRRLVDLVLLEPDRYRVGRPDADGICPVIELEDSLALPPPFVSADRGGVSTNRKRIDRWKRFAGWKGIEIVGRVTVGAGAQIYSVRIVDPDTRVGRPPASTMYEFRPCSMSAITSRSTTRGPPGSCRQTAG
jgi:hypothetical protein